MTGKTIKIFGQFPLMGLFTLTERDMHASVRSENENWILNVNESEYIAYLADKFRVLPLEIHLDKMFVSHSEKEIPAEKFPNGFDVMRGQTYPLQVIRYHVPFSGNESLLSFSPSSGIAWSTSVELEDNCICFDIINFHNKAEDIRKKAESIKERIQSQANNINKEVETFNSTVERIAGREFHERKEHILRDLSLLGSLGVPMEKSERVPETFTVPIAKRKVIEKPEAPTSAYTPDPTLEESAYEAILKIMHDAGVEMERHPSIYAGKDEETLRDHFIMVLAPHFDSTTGETFNKSGKTDILIRHVNKNLFVAECKFWTGAKGFQETIDQLLGYLTWRDSKSAAILFVRNKELNPVLQQIEAEASMHSCFVKNQGKKNESWFSFEFKLPSDSTRSVRTAVLCFHFPSNVACFAS